LPDTRPNISGAVVDARGNPVPFAFVDIQPTSPLVGMGQIERADATGTFHVYEVTPTTYRVRATAPGRGVIETTIESPRHDLRLQLSGTGRIVGTTTDLNSGAFELAFSHCGSKDDPQPVANQARLVSVSGGRFAIDGAPACPLTFIARWRGQVHEGKVVVD